MVLRKMQTRRQLSSEVSGMTGHTNIWPTGECETPVVLISCPADLRELATVDRQREACEIFEFPGVFVVDGTIDEDTLDALREGLSDQRRKFKDKFNHGLPTSERFKAAYLYTAARIRELTENLFGYRLPDKGNRSYRPMITENEPLHLDTYAIECGKTALMSVLNFDVSPRVWNVGPSLGWICREHPDDVTRMIGQLGPGESLNMRLRDAGLSGEGPLRSGTPIKRIEFAPGAVWYANPKAISHQIIYGGGAQFETWTIDEPQCSCPKCAVGAAGLRFDSLPEAELLVALR
jgi:hypothetical protein